MAVPSPSATEAIPPTAPQGPHKPEQSPESAISESTDVSSPSSALPVSPPAPTTPLPPSAKAQTNTPNPTTKTTGVVYHLSPQTIRITNCPCTDSKRDLPNTQAYLEYFLFSVGKVWERTLNTNTPPPEALMQSAERVFRHLREGGHELFHLSGVDLPEALTGPKRKEISIMIMVRSSDPADVKTGHRLVGEICIHLFKYGKKTDIVENVAYRFQEDWYDWHLNRPETFIPHPDGDQKVRFTVDNQRWVTGKMILGKVYTEVLGLLGKDVMLPAKSFIIFIGKVGRVLSGLGRDTATFEFEKVMMEKHGSQQGSGISFIRLGMLIVNDKKELVPAAHIFIEIPPPRPDGKPSVVGHLGVIYAWEWPVCHQYRKDIEPPHNRLAASRLNAVA